jgi:hypothetical protein
MEGARKRGPRLRAEVQQVAAGEVEERRARGGWLAAG